MRDLSFRRRHKRKVNNRNKGQKRRERRMRREASSVTVWSVLQWVFQIGVVCLIAFVLVWFWGQRVACVGDSMNPSIENGDSIMVNRIIYNATRPKRGDVIVFKPNGNENAYYYVKRIVGLPGEKVQIKEGKVYINGKRLKTTREYSDMDDPGVAAEEIELAGDEYFVLGDNRNSSEDSRTADIGNVKQNEIYGKGWFILTPGSTFGFVKR